MARPLTAVVLANWGQRVYVLPQVRDPALALFPSLSSSFQGLCPSRLTPIHPALAAGKLEGRKDACASLLPSHKRLSIR